MCKTTEQLINKLLFNFIQHDANLFPCLLHVFNVAVTGIHPRTLTHLKRRTNTADPVVFTLTPPECFMEIRSGYGLTGPRITGPVHVGDPVTLAINMRSRWDGFDMVVNDCVAHNGANKKIQLIDHQG